MARRLNRSKSTRELKTKLPLADEELPSFPSCSLQYTPNKLVRKRAGTMTAEPKLATSKSIADLKVTIHKGVVVPMPLNASSISLGATMKSFSGPKDFYFNPPRTSSRASSTVRTPHIGLAIGTPTMERNVYFDGPQKRESASNHTGLIPAFYLPAEPLEVGRKEEGKDAGHHNSNEQQEGRYGWRKFFGRRFGSRKGSAPPPPPPQQSSRTPAPRVLVKAQPNKPWREVPSVEPAVPAATSTPEGRSRSAGPPDLLDVNIPKVEMERYSVMFKAFLQNEGALPYSPNSPKLGNASPKPTLFDRRRSRDLLNGSSVTQEPPRLHLENLKRHATTGARITPTMALISSSPNIFSPEISTTISTEAPQQSTGRLKRSNTTAALTRNPRPGPGFVMISTTPDTETFPPLPSQDSDVIPRSRSTKSTHVVNRTRPDSPASKVSVDSSIATPNGSFAEGDDKWLQKKSDELVSAILTERATVTGMPDAHNAPWGLVEEPQPMMMTGQPQTEEEIILAAELSIQRQISISQRQLLLPIMRERGRRRKWTEDGNAGVTAAAASSTTGTSTTVAPALDAEAPRRIHDFAWANQKE